MKEILVYFRASHCGIMLQSYDRVISVLATRAMIIEGRRK